jgi:hypothetical protein
MDFEWSCYARVSATLARVLSTAAAVAGTAALAGWAVGVTVSFAPTLNWALFLSGLALLLVARVR